MGPESGAGGASVSAGRKPQHCLGPPLEAAAWGEEMEPRAGRTSGALRARAAGVGRQHEGAPPQDGEGELQLDPFTGSPSAVSKFTGDVNADIF